MTKENISKSESGGTEKNGGEETAGDINKMFQNMKEGFLIGCNEREVKLLKEQGYLSFKVEEAANIFREKHPDWIEESQGDEHKFYPPLKEQGSGIDTGKAEQILDLERMSYQELRNKMSQLRESLMLLKSESFHQKDKQEIEQKIKNTRIALEKINEEIKKRGPEVVEQAAQETEEKVDDKTDELQTAVEQAPASVAGEVQEVAERGEAIADQTKKKVGWWGKKWGQIKGVFSSKEVRKTLGKMGYDTATTLIGIKSYTDLLGILFKKGDIYNYRQQSKTVKTEKEQLSEMTDGIAELWRQRRLTRTVEAVNQRKQDATQENIVEGNKPLQEAIVQFRTMLENATSISPAEKKEFKKILANILSERSRRVEECENKTDDKAKNAMDLYLHTKISSLKLVKDGLNTALSGMQLHAFRAPMYMAMSTLERVEKANLSFEKRKLKGETVAPETEEESKFVAIAKELTIVATTEFFRSITFQAKTEERKKMGGKVIMMDFTVAFGQLIRILGLVGIGIGDIIKDDGSLFDGNIFDRVKESTGQSINKLAEAYNTGGVIGVAGQVGKNYIENAENLLFWRKKPGSGEEESKEQNQKQEDLQKQMERKDGHGKYDEPIPQQEPAGPDPEHLKLATIGKGEGAEHAFIRQIEHDPVKFGFKGDIADKAEIHAFAGAEAHRIALDKGIIKINPDGTIVQIRTEVADRIAVPIDVVDGKVSVEEIDMTNGAVGSPDTINAYEYGYTPPPPPSPSLPIGPEVPTMAEEAIVLPVAPYGPELATLQPDLNIEAPIPLPQDVQDNIDDFNNLMENNGSEKDVSKAIESLVNDYRDNRSLAGDPEFNQTINKALNHQLEDILEKGGGLFRGRTDQAIENIVKDMTQVNGFSINEANAFIKQIGGSDGISLEDMMHFTSNGQFNQERLQWAIQDFNQMIHSGKIPINAEFTPRWVNLIDEAGKKTPKLVNMRMVNNNVEMDLNNDGISDEVYNPKSAENIMKSFSEQEKIMHEAAAKAAEMEATRRFNEGVKASGQRIEEMKRTDIGIPHKESGMEIKQETLAEQATNQGMARTFTPGEGPDDTTSLKGPLPETETSGESVTKEVLKKTFVPEARPDDTDSLTHTHLPGAKSHGENLTNEAFKKTFSHPSSSEGVTQSIPSPVENPPIADGRAVPPPPLGVAPTLDGGGGHSPVEAPSIIEGGPVPPPPLGRMPTLGGEGAEIPPVHHVDTVPGSDQLDLSKVPGKGSTPVFTRAPKPFSIEDTFMPGSRAGVNMELDPLPAPDNLSESAVQTLDHLKNIAKGVVGQPGPTIERADALETLARLKKSNPSDWERILEDHQSKGENSALREHLLQERAQLKDELEKIANKPVSTPKTAEVPSIIQHKPEIIQHQPAVQVEPVPVPPPAPSIRPETIPPTSQSPDNLPVAESAPSDTTLINFIKQKFGEGNIKSKTIGDKSYLTHTSARGEVTYLKPDGVKMTFDESAGIRLRDGGLTGDGAANIVREAREAKQEATKDLLNDMDDMMQQARGRK